MVESQPKYLIDEKKAQPLEEIEPELAQTKLAKALKDIPLLKSNQLKRPTIQDRFFANDGDELEFDIQELPALGKSIPFTKQQNMVSPSKQIIQGPQLTLKRQEGNNFGQIKKEQAAVEDSNCVGDQQFNLENCPNLDDESYDWNQTTNSRSTCSNGELQHIPSLKGKMKNILGGSSEDMQSISREIADHQDDNDELMDDIDVLEINRAPTPLFMKKTKSNKLNSSSKNHNLEEEKIEDIGGEHYANFSQTCKFKQPMLQRQGGLIGSKNFAKAFPYLE